MKPYPLALQLYSLREEAAKDFPAVLKKVADIGYAGVEFAGYHGMAPADVKKILDDLGMEAASTHGPLPTKESIGEIVETAGIFGFKHHVSGFGPNDFETKEKALATAARLREAGELLKGTGIVFSYHNHWWEFETKHDDKTAHQLLMEEVPEACAQIDTYWAAVGGADPAAVVSSIGERAPLLHIKDGPINQKDPHMAVGSGKMDWESVIGAASDTTEWLIVELDRCGTDMTEAVEESCRYLTENGFAKGTK